MITSGRLAFQFHWDLKKAKANDAKHGVSFEQATTIFADPLARIFGDAEHSNGENRELIIGHSDHIT